MNLPGRIAAWLDVRPHEVRAVSLSFLGAFFVMGFLVLARSLREALYLTSFAVETLPYITAAVAVLSVPTVGVFIRLITRHHPKRIFAAVLVALAAGLLLLWPVASRHDAAVVAFYLWTALGTLLITSGFWIVISDYFPVRGAKRLYGLIGAGGTAGAMVMGNSLVWLTRQIDLSWLIPGLILILSITLAVQRLLPHTESSPSQAADDEGDTAMGSALSLVWRSQHLRTVAAIVFIVAVATTMLDYQFKELARGSMATKEELTSFFGAFYGWTGGLSLLIQLLVVARFLSFAGVGWSLAVLPLVLLLGSVGVLAAPTLLLVTLVRGSDATLRKSLYLSALEILYVPIPAMLRRRTKTFIDSVLDSGAEGLGAAIVFFWVTLNGLPSRFLSIFIAALAVVLIVLSRRMGHQYFATVTRQLQATGRRAEGRAAAARLEGRDLLTGTFTRLDLQTLIADRPGEAGPSVFEEQAGMDGEDRVLARLQSPDLRTVARALEETTEWDERHVPVLARLFARDALYDRVIAAFLQVSDAAVPHLAELLRDAGTDFVIRRRIPRVLALIGGPQADAALLDALSAERFEVRYRAAIALVRRRRHGLPRARRADELVWQAIRLEVGHSRPVWEMQRLLDEAPRDDQLVSKRIGVRGELSLEHTFRLLTLLLEPEAVRAAFNGVVLADEKLKSYSLEFLEQVLPADVRARLWPFIGDVSEHKRDKSLRSLDEVVSDLLSTGATLFVDVQDRKALRQILEERDE